jgi:RimJ/RimL family protein N-acetyltransferase
VDDLTRGPQKREATAPAWPGSAEAEVALRNGARVLLRPIRPEDSEALALGFERLSEESRYRRFLSPIPRLSSSLLRYMTEVDHHDHEALVAFAPDGALLGVARSVRSNEDRGSAEAAVVVADDWQGLGLGTALLELLARRARAEGIDRFIALVLAENQEMIDLFERLGRVSVIGRSSGTVEIEIALPPHGVGPELHELLRGSAGDRYRVVRPSSWGM